MCCEGKVQYRTPAEADKARKAMANRHKRGEAAHNRRGLVLYRCQWCSLWHLGREDGRVNQKQKRKERDRIHRRLNTFYSSLA